MINPFKKTYSGKDLKLFKFLSQVKLFEKLTFAEMSHFVPYLYLRQYKKDEVVFFRGDPANALYIIRSGKIGLSLDIKDRTETLKICLSEEAFGDNSMINDANRIYNAVCESENAEIYVIPKVNMFEIFAGQQKIKGKMLMSLVEIYNGLTSNLFKSYRNSFGFFNLAQIFIDPKDEDDENNFK
jgi:CRP/FNR family transcriptional regulator, cyclic AMP receptor protein